MQRDAVPLGYRIESVWGTDPLASNLAILGLVTSCKVTVEQNREARRGVGAGVDPLLFVWKEQRVSVDLEWDVQDENPANSLISLFLGDAPNGATGAIVNRPNATDKNLRTFTLEVGFNWPNTDEYWQVKGLMGQRLELAWTDHVLKAKANFVGKSVSKTSAIALAAPSLSALAPFDGYEDGTLSFAAPAVANPMSDNFRVIVENVLRHKGIIGGGRTIGYLQVAGRNVFAEFDALKTGSEFVDLFLAEPNTAAGNVDITATVSKSAGAEYISAVLSNAEVVSQGGPPEVKDSDEEFEEAWRFQAKTYAFDVKS